jgi:hypothetical protein
MMEQLRAAQLTLAPLSTKLRVPLHPEHEHAESQFACAWRVIAMSLWPNQKIQRRAQGQWDHSDVVQYGSSKRQGMYGKKRN